MPMRKTQSIEVISICTAESEAIIGGGPILDSIEWYYKTVGSLYRGFWDGLTGKDPAV